MLCLWHSVLFAVYGPFLYGYTSDLQQVEGKPQTDGRAKKFLGMTRQRLKRWSKQQALEQSPER